MANDLKNNTIGLFAGNRSFPLIFSQQAKLKSPDSKLVVVALKGETSKSIEKYADEILWVWPGEVRRPIEFFKSKKVSNVVMVGQISPFRIFVSRFRWDDLMLEIANNIKDYRPHSVFGALVEMFAKHELSFMDSTTFMDESLAKEGLNNSVVASDEIKEEIDYALGIAKNVVEFDIGQTVVFKYGTPVAVEAFEGTDRTIKRAATVCGKEFIVIKRATKDQDMRFDVPVIGPRTLKLLAKYKAKALAIHASKTLILDKEKVFAIADKAGIAIIGYK